MVKIGWQVQHWQRDCRRKKVSACAVPSHNYRPSLMSNPWHSDFAIFPTQSGGSKGLARVLSISNSLGLSGDSLTAASDVQGFSSAVIQYADDDQARTDSQVSKCPLD